MTAALRLFLIVVYVSARVHGLLQHTTLHAWISSSSAGSSSRTTFARTACGPAPAFPSQALCRGTLRPRGRPTLALGAIKAVERMVGGDVESNGIFDPFGFSSDEPSLFRRRAVELKHGRVCMLATLGVLVQSVWRPFSEPYLQNPRPLGALRDCWEAKSAYVCLAVLAVGLLDCTLGKQDYDSRAPGDLGLFADWAKPDTQEAWENTQLSELKHGRLAMVAIVAMLLQEPLLGDGPIQIAYDVTTPVRDIVLDATRTVIRSL